MVPLTVLKHLNGYKKAPELLINPTANCLMILIIPRRVTSLSKQMDLYNELLTAIWETRIVSYMWGESSFIDIRHALP